MAKIILHTPRHLTDDKTVTEFEADDILHVRSQLGDDNREGTLFYLKGVEKKQFCLEPAGQVKKMIEENKTDNESADKNRKGRAAISFWLTLISALVGLISLLVMLL